MTASSTETQMLPVQLQEFLQLLEWGLKWLGKSFLGFLDQGSLQSADTEFLTDRPALASLLPYNQPGTARPTKEAPTVCDKYSYKPFQKNFQLKRQDNIKVYAGSLTGSIQTLSDLQRFCRDPNIDAITIAGVTDFSGDDRSPILNLGDLCSGNCSFLSTTLQKCQQDAGKTLLLAVEIDTPTTILSSEMEAKSLASQLWNAYGDGRTTWNRGPRKSGGPLWSMLEVSFNRFQFRANSTTIVQEAERSVEKRQSTFMAPTLPYFDTLFATLREQFDSTNDNEYYLSVSLPCTRPSVLSKSALHLVDFVSIRFSNDPACDIDGFSFNDFLGVRAEDVEDTAPDRLGPSLQSSTSPAAPKAHTTTKIELMTSTRVHKLVLTSFRSPNSTFTGTAFAQNTTATGTVEYRLDSELFDAPRYVPTATAGTGYAAVTLLNSSDPEDGFDQGNEFELDSGGYDSNTSGEAHDTGSPEPLIARMLVERAVQGSLPVNRTSTPRFFVGISAPSSIQYNSPASSGTGSSDPATLSAIFDYARRSVPGFAGVLIWGSGRDLISNNGSYEIVASVKKDLGAMLADGSATSKTELISLPEATSMVAKLTGGGGSDAYGSQHEASSAESTVIVQEFLTKTITVHVHASAMSTGATDSA